MEDRISILVPTKKYCGQEIKKKISEQMPWIKNFVPIHSTKIEGLGKARNDLARQALTFGIIFIDDDVSFTEETFNKFIKTALEKNYVICYEGDNEILCTRVLAIQKDVFVNVNGFDETFNIGEDMEFGLRLIESGIKTLTIPKHLVLHAEHQKEQSYVLALKVRVRCALRYKRFDLLKIKRKKDIVGLTLTPFILFYYIFNNRRIGYNRM